MKNIEKEKKRKIQNRDLLLIVTLFLSAALNIFVLFSFPTKGFLSSIFGALFKSLQYQIFLNIGILGAKNLIFFS